MADPQTVNTGLFVPNLGADVGAWNIPVNSDFVSIDGFIGGVQTISAAGSASFVLTSPSGFVPTPSGGPTQSQNGVIRFTGAQTANITITLPLPGHLIIENLTTGAFWLGFRAIGVGQVIAIQQGSCKQVYNDGTNVRFVNLPDVGTYLDIAAASIPSWIAACTIPPYLNCDGSAFSAGTYPYLANFLGGTTLPDARGRARYTLNQGVNRITAGGQSIDGNTLFAGGGTQFISQGNFPAVNFNVSGITLSQGGSSLFVDASVSSTNGNNAPRGSLGGPNAQVTSQVVFTNVSVATQGVAASGGSQLSIASPGYASGLTLIRAA